MALPQRTRPPILVKHELRGVIIILVQSILDTAFFGPRNRNQFFKLRSDEVDLFSVSMNVGDDGKVRHSNALSCFRA